MLFEVDTTTDVVDSAGMVIGRLHPGQVYEAIELGDPWIVIGGSGGTRAFVARSAVRPVVDQSTAEDQPSAVSPPPPEGCCG